MAEPNTNSGGEVKFSIVSVSRMPSVIRNQGKYAKVVEAARNLKLATSQTKLPSGELGYDDPSIRIPLGKGDKVNRNAAATLNNHVKEFPGQTRTETRDGKETQVKYAMRVSTRTEGDAVFAYIYLDETA